MTEEEVTELSGNGIPPSVTHECEQIAYPQGPTYSGNRKMFS